MRNLNHTQMQSLSRYVGWSLLATIVLGILASVFVSSGININMSADISETANNMLVAEERLRAKAYLTIFMFMLEGFISVGFFFLLREHGAVLATWTLLIGIAAAVLTLMGAVYAMNAALIAGNSAFQTLADPEQRLLFTALQVTGDYTSFHLSLVLSSFASAGVFYLFLKSNLIHKLIASWGLFASLFVAITIVARDFIPVLGHNAITGAFMVSNLIAMLALALFLALKGVNRSRP